MITGAIVRVRRAVRLGRYADARAAVRELGTAGVDGCPLGVRLMYALEESGVSQHRARTLHDWLLAHAAAGTNENADVTRLAYEPRAEDRYGAVRIEAGNLTEQVDKAEEALLAAGWNLYQRGGQIVRIGYVDGENGREVPHVMPVDETHLTELFGRAVEWFRFDARAKKEVATRCPREVAAAYIARGPIEWKLPRLAGVIEAPTLRADGSLLNIPGHDADATGLYLSSRNEEFPDVPHRPTQADAEDALETLDDLICEFPFVAEHDRSVALAAILTAAIRRSLPTSPVFAFTAPAAGSGKSLLNQIVARIATGRPVQGMSWADEAENRKALDAALLAGVSMISVDNATAPIGGDRLCQMVTESHASVRVLGRSENVEVSSRALIVVNGNNLAIAADMTRRTMLCRLDAEVERPELREFKGDPLALLEADRGRYLAAALTILRAYHVAGRPEQPRPLGSFEAWSSWVRGALLWLGEADPVDSLNTAREADPVLSALNAVLGQWHAVLGHERYTTAQIIAAASQHSEFREALLAVAGAGGAINTMRLGKWLASMKGKLAGGMKVGPAGVIRGSGTWALEGGGDVTPACAKGVAARGDEFRAEAIFP